MKNIYIIVGVFMMLCSITALAQQTPEYTFWRQNMVLVNPAYVGSTEKVEISINSYKDKLQGVYEGPKTLSLTAQWSLNDKVGLGLDIVTDNVFIQKETNVFVDYSYKLSFGEKRDLYLGLKAGGSFFNVDFSRLKTVDPANQGEVSNFNPNVGIGVYYKANNYFVSLSAPRILKAKRYEDVSGVAQEASDATLLMFGGGYYYDLSTDIQIVPAFMTRYIDGAPFSFDLSTSVRFYDKMELGVNYRLNNAISAMVSFEILKMIEIGFAYDYSISTINTQTDGGPEFLLKVKF